MCRSLNTNETAGRDCTLHTVESSGLHFKLSNEGFFSDRISPVHQPRYIVFLSPRWSPRTTPGLLLFFAFSISSHLQPQYMCSRGQSPPFSACAHTCWVLHYPRMLVGSRNELKPTVVGRADGGIIPRILVDPRNELKPTVVGRANSGIIPPTWWVYPPYFLQCWQQAQQLWCLLGRNI